MQEPLPLLENTKLRRNGFHSPNEQEVEEQFELEKALKNVTYPTRSLEFLKDLEPTRSEADTKVMRLSILVIGAGLGGLTTATALALRGHTVTVIEQASVIKEVGAGIQIPSNSSRILHSLGLGPYLQPHVVEPEAISFRRWQDGSRIAYTKLVPDFREKFDAPFYVVHRAHFHQALLGRAIEVGVTVKTNHKVTSFNESEPSVTVEGTGELNADLVVAADGIKSLARQQIDVRQDGGPINTGFAAYRATVDVSKMREDPETSSLLDSPAQNIWIGDGRHVMSYSIASGKSFNMVLSHKDHSDPSTWSQRNTIQDMRKEFSGWDPRLVKVINMVEKTAKWPLAISKPPKTWLSPSKRLLMIGDAAHAMLPYMSQGAAMAVEDGAALAEALTFAHSSDDLSTVLEAFEKVRLERTTQMQQASLVNGKIWHFADGPEQLARDEGMRPEVLGRPLRQSPNQWTDPTTQIWAYGYDAVEVMREALLKGSTDLENGTR